MIMETLKARGNVVPIQFADEESVSIEVRRGVIHMEETPTDLVPRDIPVPVTPMLVNHTGGGTEFFGRGAW
jgi:hypothetical protein